jgi:hypothetical protein
VPDLGKIAVLFQTVAIIATENYARIPVAYG